MAASELYPLSTQDGQAIPFDIVKPSSLVFWTLVADTQKNATIPAGFVTGFFFCTTDCVFRNADVTLVGMAEATEYADAIFIPSNTVVSVTLTPGASKIMPLGNGTLYLSKVQQWAALVQTIQSQLG